MRQAASVAAAGDRPVEEEHHGDVGRHLDGAHDERVDEHGAREARRVERQAVVHQTVDEPETGPSRRRRLWW